MGASCSQHEVYLPSGLPVLVTVRWFKAEPDVGIMSPWCEVDRVQIISRRKRADGTRGKPRIKDFWRDLTQEEAASVLEQIP